MNISNDNFVLTLNALMESDSVKADLGKVFAVDNEIEEIEKVRKVSKEERWEMLIRAGAVWA